MEIEQILLDAKNLIQVGRQAFLKETKRTLYFDDSEYYIVYSKAIDLLLKAYNSKTEFKINKFFVEHIPEPLDYKDIKEFSELSDQFENLKSSDVNVRIKASRFFRGKALASTSGFRAMIFKRPDIFEKLFYMLQDEEERVKENIIITLGGAYNRYFKHFRVFEKTVPFFNAKNNNLRYYSLIWTPKISHLEQDEILMKMMKAKQPQKIREALCRRISCLSKEELKLESIRFAIIFWEQTKNISIRNAILRSILAIATPENIVEFKRSIISNKDAQLKMELEKIINQSFSGTELVFLQANLL
jgi:hypothetical protein